MKRSEMIKIIKDTLEANDYSESSTSAEEMASIIMYEIDEAGMLPPRTKLDKLNFEDNAWDPEDKDESI